MIQVKQGIFPPIGNNCYLITDSGTGQAALVDCSVWDERMRRFIGDADLRYILLTHGHFDHIGGVKDVSRHYGAKVVISREDDAMLRSPMLSLAAFTGGRQQSVTADMLIGDGDIISLGETEIHVIATPGHTEGSVCFLADDCLFTGDTLFCESCGRTDFPGGSVTDMRLSLQRLAALKGDYRVFPGHEELTTLDHERKYNPLTR